MKIETKTQIMAPARHLPFEVVSLVLQGGGALGAYQAGVYEAMSEADIHPTPGQTDVRLNSSARQPASDDRSAAE
jgi:hypothetical protein